MKTDSTTLSNTTDSSAKHGIDNVAFENDEKIKRRSTNRKKSENDPPVENLGFKSNENATDSPPGDTVNLKRNLSLLSGIALIVGTMIGK